MDNQLRVLVCQLGAREHYLVARCLAQSGALARLATDFWSLIHPQRLPFKNWLPKVAIAALGRCHPGLNNRQVVSFPFLSLSRYLLGRQDRSGESEKLVGERFARAVGRLEIPHNVFFGYSYDSLEMLRAERKRGVFTMLCQTDPGPAHYRMIGEEAQRWPEYGGASSNQRDQRRAERLKQEWELADVIVVNSEWTKESIISEGVDPAKIELLPLAYELTSRCPLPPVPCPLSPVSRPLKILFLGNVALGKGIQYLVEAARLLVDEPVEFTVGGSLHISQEVVASSPKNIRWLGRISRSATDELYQQCDVFVFPTLSDGFGITQLEAMAHGVPVIATPNCGRVVEDGKNGFIVPARDAPSLAEAIRRFVDNPELSTAMLPACIETAKSFSVDRYGCRLSEIIEERREQGLRVD